MTDEFHRTTRKFCPPPYLPSELGLAASHAVIELECDAQEKPEGFDSTKQLADLIKTARELDVAVEVALFRSLSALSKGGTGAPVRTRPEALHAADEWYEKLRQVETLSRPERKAVQDFCLQLLDNIAASREQMQPWDPIENLRGAA